MRLTRRSVNLGVAASLATPAFSRIARAADDTIKIGMVLPVTGPAADSGKYALTGAKIALDRVNKSGGVLGKQVELVTEDDQTTNPGAVLAFSKLAAQPDIVAFLGSIRSTQNHAMARRHPEDRQTRLLRRHRSRADEDGQSLADPLPAERFLLGPRDRLLRRGDAGKEELGDRPFDRRVRHGRLEGLVGLARQARRKGRNRPGLSQPEPGFHAGRARDQIVRRRHHRLLFHLLQRSGDLRATVAAARRDAPLGRIAHDRHRRGGETRRPRALGHIRHRRLRRRFEPGGEGIRQAL